MSRLFVAILALTISVTLAACDQQPTEMQKARIEKGIPKCLMAVTPEIGGESTNLFSSLAELTEKMASFAKQTPGKSWKITSDDVPIITMTIKFDETTYDCDYTEAINSRSWVLAEVRRNTEVVYNQADAQKVNQENKRIREEKHKEELRLAEELRKEKLQRWQEKEYSNVAYKYYEKDHQGYDGKSWSSPTLKVVCSPKYVRVEFDNGRISMQGERGIEFKFSSKGKTSSHKFDLTSGGGIGKYNNRQFMPDVEFDALKTQGFIKLMKSSTSLEIKGFKFLMDDLSQIPCLQS